MSRPIETMNGVFDTPPAIPPPNPNDIGRDTRPTVERPGYSVNEPVYHDAERRVRVLQRMRRRQTQREHRAVHIPSSEVSRQGYDTSRSDSRASLDQMASNASLTPRRLSIERISADLRRAELNLARMRQRAQEMANQNLTQVQSTEEARIRPRLSNVNGDAAQESSGEAEVNRQRAKRRKLDSDTLNGNFKPFSYGYRGQAVAGPLMMEMVSCDGGLMTTPPGTIRDYWPENILRNDRTVYCTKVSKCNIVLRHQNETTFTLRKIIIKAPESGFTSPIQEGLIFIAMDVKDLLKQTSAYQIRESSPSLSSESDSEADPIAFDRRRASGRVRIMDAAVGRPPSRRADPGTPRVVPPPISSAHLPLTLLDHDTELPSIAADTDPVIGAPPAPPFEVTVHCDTPSSDEEVESNATTLADRHLRNLLTAGSSDSEDLSGRTSRHVRIRRRSRRRSLPSRIEIIPSLKKEDERNNQAKYGNAGNDVLAPHARFFIEPEKSTVTVRFEPEVSGKYILLKLWSSAPDQNIDIQSIVVHGFAGGRFFPSTELA